MRPGRRAPEGSRRWLTRSLAPRRRSSPNLPVSPWSQRAPSPKPEPPAAAAKPARAVAKVMVYTHPKVARKFKELAFLSDRKTNDVILDALDLYLERNGHGGIKGVIGR